jgi:hypothetical protein
MGHTMVAWKILEELLIELRKKGIQVPVNVFEDLRAARSMIFFIIAPPLFSSFHPSVQGNTDGQREF